MRAVPGLGLAPSGPRRQERMVTAGLGSAWWQYLLLFLAVAASWAGVPVIGTAGLGAAAGSPPATHRARYRHLGHRARRRAIVVAARRRRRRREARPLGAAADRAPEDPS